ncbi:MAG: hypothetical protein U1E50_08725 [Caulobacteraceae bacterium]
MAQIQPCPLPPDALLGRYASQGFTDCYSLDVPEAVPFARFVEAFYRGGVFQIELTLIRLVFSKPSSGAMAGQLARGEIDAFSGWVVEDRAQDQLLMREVMGGNTRSWLMAEPHEGGTRLYFGSAVLPGRDKATGEARMSPLFAPLMGFHKAYSRVLLAGALARLEI